jgi:tRNA(Ile)-lysidine synthase
MTLSHLLLACDLPHSLLHCNFTLRGQESDEDAKFIAKYAQANGLAYHIKRFDTKQIALKEGLTIQETARKLRYEWFETFLIEDIRSRLLTAHHLDDSIETFFINLLRGTSLKGLTGISVKKGQILRPLYQFNTEAIEQYIETNKIEFRHDSSNATTKYLRNKLRHDILPLLAENTTGFSKKMLGTLSSLQEVNTWMENAAAQFREIHFKAANGIEVDVASILKEDKIFIIEIFKPFGIQRSNAEEFLSFLKASSGSVFNTSNYRYMLNRDKVILVVHESTSKESKAVFTVAAVPHQIETDGLHIQFKSTSQLVSYTIGNIQQLDFERIDFPLQLRHWQEGDKIKPLGLNGHKLLSDVFIDHINKKTSFQ